MTTDDGRSVAELRRESERTRAELTQTVEALRGQISETAAGVRRTISPDNIRAEVSGYVADKGRGWLTALQQQAMDNPMQAIAAGTALAMPAMRLARSIPLPMLMIGAGLALASPRVRNAMADKIADATGVAPGDALDNAQNVAGEKLRAATAAAEGAADKAAQAVQDVRSVMGGAVTQAGDAATKLSADLKDRVAAGRDLMSEKLDAATQAAGDAFDAARTKSAETLNAARESATTVVRDNALVVAGIGLAIGAFLAASLPTTRAEQQTMGDASEKLRSKVSGAAEETFDRVKSAAMSAADDIQAEVGKGIDRFSEVATDKLRNVTDEAVTTAFEPTPSHR
jgi:hypothetical protein